jgi:hypothetical protein
VSLGQLARAHRLSSPLLRMRLQVRQGGQQSRGIAVFKRNADGLCRQ